MRKYEFSPAELPEEIFAIYSDSSITFYKSGETFFAGFNPKEEPFEVGGLQDVIEFLEGLA